MKEIEFIVQNLLGEKNKQTKNTTPSPDSLTGKFYPTFKEAVTPFYTTFPGKQKRRHVPMHFMRPALP